MHLFIPFMATLLLSACGVSGPSGIPKFEKMKSKECDEPPVLTLKLGGQLDVGLGDIPGAQLARGKYIGDAYLLEYPGGKTLHIVHQKHCYAFRVIQLFVHTQGKKIKSVRISPDTKALPRYPDAVNYTREYLIKSGVPVGDSGFLEKLGRWEQSEHGPPLKSGTSLYFNGLAMSLSIYKIRANETWFPSIYLGLDVLKDVRGGVAGDNEDEGE